MKLLDGLYSYEIILLILGVILFIVLTIALLYMIMKHRPIKSLALFFPIPIVMIGFPGIQSFQLGKDLLTVEREKQQLMENPADSAARADLTKKLEVLTSRPISNPKALVSIAEAQAVVGDSVKAWETSEKLLQKDPQAAEAKRLRKQLSTPSVLLNKDLAKLKENPDNQEAKASLARSLDSIENHIITFDPYVGYQAARAHLVLGDTATAKTTLDSIAVQYPSNKRIKTLRQKIGN